jgi:hypothetical protein
MHGQPAIVVTGASSGIGAELARVAAREGRELVLVACSAVPLTVLAAEWAAGGPLAHAVPLDLAAPDAATALGFALMERGLRCEVLVNNAGVGLVHPAARIEAPALAALPPTLAHGSGGVPNVGSVARFLPGPGMAMYYASKAGLRSLSEALWSETRGSGVTVTCLCPGPIRTPFNDRVGGRGLRLFQLVTKADPRRNGDCGG